ncbi:hypothetical protein Anapl_14348 [Anas platyrhynchos]|uniref:Uncharacterized protein n=1 Tax=Anas platyrhynchos TaxID=8839 RepID=R0KZM3_ANAPL|nr:hypothetical protein Anapl_14348 [Anas platyrhynchos]
MTKRGLGLVVGLRLLVGKRRRKELELSSPGCRPSTSTRRRFLTPRWSQRIQISPVPVRDHAAVYVAHVEEGRLWIEGSVAAHSQVFQPAFLCPDNAESVKVFTEIPQLELKMQAVLWAPLKRSISFCLASRKCGFSFSPEAPKVCGVTVHAGAPNLHMILSVTQSKCDANLQSQLTTEGCRCSELPGAKLAVSGQGGLMVFIKRCFVARLPRSTFACRVEVAAEVSSGCWGQEHVWGTGPGLRVIQASKHHVMWQVQLIQSALENSF